MPGRVSLPLRHKYGEGTEFGDLDDPGGAIPSDPVALQKLPGIGPYTAAAVASIAFALVVKPASHLGVVDAHRPRPVTPATTRR